MQNTAERSEISEFHYLEAVTKGLEHTTGFFEHVCQPRVLLGWVQMGGARLLSLPGHHPACLPQSQLFFCELAFSVKNGSPKESQF